MQRNRSADDRPIHHAIFAQAAAVRRDGKVYIPAHHNGNFRAYGQLVPGTVIVLPEDENLRLEVAVPLAPELTPILLPNFTTRNVLRRSMAYRSARTRIRDLVSRTTFIQVQHVSACGMLAGVAAAEMNKALYVDIGGTMRDPRGGRRKRAWYSKLAMLHYIKAEKRMAAHARLVIAVSG